MRHHPSVTSDEVDSDTPQSPPPPELLAVFLFPLLVLFVWALMQG